MKQIVLLLFNLVKMSDRNRVRKRNFFSVSLESNSDGDVQPSEAREQRDGQQRKYYRLRANESHLMRPLTISDHHEAREEHGANVSGEGSRVGSSDINVEHPPLPVQHDVGVNMERAGSNGANGNVQGHHSDHELHVDNHDDDNDFDNQADDDNIHNHADDEDDVDNDAGDLEEVQIEADDMEELLHPNGTFLI